MRWLLLLAMAAMVWVGLTPYRPPAVVSDAAPDTVFSAERAMRHVRAIAVEPRPVGSAEHGRVRDYLASQLGSLGAQVAFRPAVRVSRRRGDVVTLENIVARFRGSGAGGKAVLLAAHYDGSRNGPAAGDDAAGVAAILETVRAIRAGPTPINDLIVLFSDGEELGLLGAAAFREEHPWMAAASLVLNFEGRGTHGPSLMFETAPGNRAVIRTFGRVAPHAAGSSLAYTIYKLLPNDTDFSELRKSGAQGLNFAFIRGVRHYHRAGDTPDRLDVRSVQHHGSSALGLTRHYLSAELPPPAQVSDGDAVFFNLPIIGLVSYAEGMAMPLALLLVAAVVAGAWRVRARGHATVRGSLIAHASLAAGLLAGVIGAEGAWWVIHRLSSGGVSNARPDLSAAWFIATVAVAAAFGLRVMRWALKRASPWDISLSGAVAAAVLSVAAANWVPGGSYAVIWPGLGAASALFFARRTPGEPGGFGSAAGALASAALALLLLPPLMVLVFDAMGINVVTVAAFALLTVLTLWWSAPCLGGLIGPRPAPQP